MDRHTENDLVIPALLYLSAQPNGAASTTALRKHLEGTLPLTPFDVQTSTGGATKFSQVVRNLVSNENPHMLAYADIDKLTSPYTWRLRKGNLEFLRLSQKPLELLGSGQFDTELGLEALEAVHVAARANAAMLVLDETVHEGDSQTRMSPTRQRSYELRQRAIAHHLAQGSLTCAVCDFDFGVKYGKLGIGFIEMHHIKPLCVYERSDLVKSLPVALANLAPLCANCHRMVHRQRPPDPEPTTS